MKNVRDIAEEIVAREGGFVNDPADPGGPTKYGVTLKTLQRLGVDLTSDGTTDMHDLRRLSRDQAVVLFVREYFEKPRIGALPEAVQPSVFDMYVNAGTNAVKILQRLLRAVGRDLTDDGIIGPLTIAAAHAAAAPDPLLFADAYSTARRNYYYRLADERPAMRKFARRKDGRKGGWIVRAEEFMSPRFRLSETDHLKRTAIWG